MPLPLTARCPATACVCKPVCKRFITQLFGVLALDSPSDAVSQNMVLSLVLSLADQQIW